MAQLGKLNFIFVSCSAAVRQGIQSQNIVEFKTFIRAPELL